MCPPIHLFQSVREIFRYKATKPELRNQFFYRVIDSMFYNKDIYSLKINLSIS